MKTATKYAVCLSAGLALFPLSTGAATLIALWDFENNYLTSNHNSSYDLNPGGGVTLVSSPFGLAAEFHGGTYPIDPPGSMSNPALDRLDTTDSVTSAAFNGGFSAMCWVKPYTDQDFLFFAHSSSVLPEGPYLGPACSYNPLTTGLSVSLRDGNDQRLNALQSNPGGISSNQWTHVAVTWNGSPTGGFALYVNGSPVPCTLNTLGAFAGLNESTSFPVRLGADLGGHHFNGGDDTVAASIGALDHLSLYSGVLTPDEVHADFSATANLPPTLNIASAVQLCWDTAPTIVYQLQSSQSLGTNTWQALGSPFTGNGARFCTDDVVTPGRGQTFYRLAVITGP